MYFSVATPILPLLRLHDHVGSCAVTIPEHTLVQCVVYNTRVLNNSSPSNKIVINMCHDWIVAIHIHVSACECCVKVTVFLKQLLS